MFQNIYAVIDLIGMLFVAVLIASCAGFALRGILKVWVSKFETQRAQARKMIQRKAEARSLGLR